jgi:hypothetical protein
MLNDQTNTHPPPLMLYAWIPVTQELPKFTRRDDTPIAGRPNAPATLMSDEVLVLEWGDCYRITHLVGGEGSEHPPQWYSASGVTHWMPLPAPPAPCTADGVQIDKLMAMPEAEVDAELRRLGIDPDEAAKRGKAAVESALQAISHHNASVRVRPDPRGPLRAVTTVRHDESGTYPTFDCGHTGSFTRCPTMTPGERLHCFKCRTQRSTGGRPWLTRKQ